VEGTPSTGACSSTSRCLGIPDLHLSVYISRAVLWGRVVSDESAVDVNVTNGVVTLAGEVPNTQVKAEAEQEARSVSGVTRVINNL
jgi:BON domain